MGPCSFNHSTGRRWVVTLMVHLLYPKGKWPWYPMCRNLDGPHRQSGWFGNRKIEPKFCGQPACSMLSQLLINPGAIATLCLYMIYSCLMQKVCFYSSLYLETWYMVWTRELFICTYNKLFLQFFLLPVLCILYYFVLWPTNAQLFHKLSHSYMFRHYHVILRELVISTLPSYTSISNAAVGNTIYN